jgi:alkanesulfonate monooxygenase SsuD/methylene tetrahydromethanopterin reductase-like flavin-dependent oxidoreductase (luciferase family)
MNEPRIRDDLPILLGGGGEKKTFALAARYADHLNIISNASELPRKIAALHERCAEIGRDPETLEVSFLCFLMIDEDGDRARKQQQDMLRGIGVDLSAISEEERRQTQADRQFVGTPAEVAEQLQTQVNMVTNGHEPGAVDLAGRTLAPLVH